MNTVIDNKLKLFLRERYDIKNITSARIKACFTSTDLYYLHLNKLYNNELDEINKLKVVETENILKLNKLKDKRKQKKLKYRLKKKLASKPILSNGNNDDVSTNEPDYNKSNDLDNYKNNDEKKDNNDDISGSSENVFMNNNLEYESCSSSSNDVNLSETSELTDNFSLTSTT